MNSKDASEGCNAEFAEATQRKKRGGKTRTLRTDPSILQGKRVGRAPQDHTLERRWGTCHSHPMVVSANGKTLRCSGLLDELS